MEITKKCWPEYFEKVLKGEKYFELRLADFELKPGDSLVLKEWNPETKEYTGREVRKKVNFVLNTKAMEQFHTKEELEKYGLQIIQLEK